MAYASFRCLVDAPFVKVWQSICYAAQRSPAVRVGATAVAIHSKSGDPIRQQIRIHDLDLLEIISINPQKGEIVIRLEGGQALRGERRFSVREDRATARLVIESSLDWQSNNDDMDRRLHGYLDTLVRDTVLEMKARSEDGIP